MARPQSNNPALPPVTMAGLVGNLSNAKCITVFAPDNAACAKILKATLDKTVANKATKILTCHVVSQKPFPDKLTSGLLATLE
ncbi:fasciclin domain-containing protein [Streptomyces sp. NPDC059819]|uniref:fasciclin domain-containing protein n=1 Tax=Streptomyces sp. NPDC059819 TaxID=3346963 RepID=UPI003653AAA1